MIKQVFEFCFATLILGVTAYLLVWMFTKLRVWVRRELWVSRQQTSVVAPKENTLAAIDWSKMNPDPKDILT